MSDPQQQARPTNPYGTAAAFLAVLALVIGLFVRLGAGLGLAAVVLACFGLARAERSDVGLAASLFGLALGVLAVFWAALFVVSGG